jgi:uncharacterized membrane protein YkoI
MNGKHTLCLISAIAALSTQAAEERISLEQLPAAVRQTVDASRGKDPVREIDRRTIDGQTVFIVEIDRNNAPNPRLRIAEDGTLLREPMTPYVSSSDIPVFVPDSTEGVPALPRLQFSDLPGPVEQKARSEANGRELADIDRENWNGRVVYEIEFKERGLNSRVYIAEDGTVVRDERRSLKSLFLGLQLEDTPSAVQASIRRHAGSREITDIDKEGTETEPVYRVEVRAPQGTQELRIAQDGKVLHDSSAAKPSRG